MAGITGVGNSSVDLQQLLAQIARRRQQQQNGATTEKPGAGNKTEATGSSGNADAVVARQTGDSDKAARQSFFRFLRQSGIDPEVFHQALLDGLKDASQGQARSSTPFQNFSPGFSVDTTA
jgi:hypothetical protein